ncbi:MAG: SH3 domain-containing protein [Lachnospiraceae bacterium]|nr:SH3 domain-containing protein [Lachnospiraceae bacterium]
MRRKAVLMLLTAAGLFLINPATAQAGQLSLGLDGGIASSISRASNATEEDIEEALNIAVTTTYTGLCVAQVNDYVNIRSGPSEDYDVVGKLYANSVGTVEGYEDGWYQITSGNVTGYVSAEYVVIGTEAEELAEEVGTRMATVTTETLRVRTEATTESSILGLIPEGEELVVTDETDDFVQVSIEEGDGWVSKEYVSLSTEYVYAESKEEEEARLAKEEADRKAAQAAAAAATSKSSNSSSDVVIGSGSGSASGNAVVSYACQFVGNPYVYGGTSLTNGTDCSGFVMSVYAHFGVSLPHSSSAMRSVGYGVSLSEIQPGDIVCYSGHVAIYVGNNTIVHASTSSTGIKYTSPVNYKTVLAVRRIF